MKIEVLGISNPMIGEPSLPDFEIRPEFLFCPVRKPSLDELDCSFKRGYRSDEQVEMVGHQNKFVEEIGFASIGKQSFEEETGPGFGLKDGPALPCLRGDKVGLRVVGGVLACGFQNFPQGLKPLFCLALFGTAEAVPLQNCSGPNQSRYSAMMSTLLEPFNPTLRG
jgi:hypothetical protein